MTELGIPSGPMLRAPSLTPQTATTLQNMSAPESPMLPTTGTGGMGATVGMAGGPVGVAIGAGVDIATTIIPAIMNYFAGKDQAEEVRKNNDRMLRLYREQAATEKNQFMVKADLERERMGMEHEERMQTRKDEKEALDYLKKMTFANNLRGYMYNNPTFRQNMIGVSQQRR